MVRSIAKVNNEHGMTMKYTTGSKWLLCCATLMGFSAGQALAESAAEELSVHEFLTDIVAIPSTYDSGRAREVGEYLAGHLLAAGFPEEDVLLLGTSNTVGGLVATLRGSGAKRPVLLMAHLDVVPANPDAWTMSSTTSGPRATARRSAS